MATGKTKPNQGGSAFLIAGELAKLVLLVIGVIAYLVPLTVANLENAGQTIASGLSQAVIDAILTASTTVFVVALIATLVGGYLEDSSENKSLARWTVLSVTIIWLLTAYSGLILTGFGA